MRAMAARLAAAETALLAASEDARIVVQDYYSGLPEHRVPVDGAIARLAHLFERDDENCEARTFEEILSEGLPARAVLVADPAAEETGEQTCECGHGSQFHDTPTVIRRVCAYPGPVGCACKGFAPAAAEAFA